MLLSVIAVPALLAALRASAAPQFVNPGLDSSTAPFLAAQEADFQAEQAEQAAQGSGPKDRRVLDASIAEEAAKTAEAIAKDADATTDNNKLSSVAAAAAVAKLGAEQAATEIGRSYSSLD